MATRPVDNAMLVDGGDLDLAVLLMGSDVVRPICCFTFLPKYLDLCVLHTFAVTAGDGQQYSGGQLSYCMRFD